MPIRPRQKVRLTLSASPGAAWPDVVRPWLMEARNAVAQGSGESVIVVPWQSLAYALKSHALADGLNLLGVRFITPVQLRSALSRTWPAERPAALREHLRLLLTAAAQWTIEQLPKEASTQAEADAARGVVRNPDSILHFILELASAGWDFLDHSPPPMRRVLQRFQQLLADAGLVLSPEIDRHLQARTREAEPIFERLLVIGFDGAHWPRFPLLHAGVLAANTASVCLRQPRHEAEELDALWVNTWEQAFGAADIVGAAEHEKDELFAWAHTHGSGMAPAETSFLVQETASQLADAVTARITGLLAGQHCRRIAVVFPRSGALSRLVSSRLAAAHIPHYDAFGFPAPIEPDVVRWRLWLNLQTARRIEDWVAFLHTRNAPNAELDCTAPNDAWEELLSARTDVGFDDLIVLADWLASKRDRTKSVATARAVLEFDWLPEHAAIADYLQQTLAAFRSLGWMDLAERIERFAGDWMSVCSAPVPLRTWTRWLGEVIEDRRRQREEAGGHPYSRIHVLDYRQAESQEWSHVILCGLTERDWPPPLRDDGWLDSRTAEQLNRKAVELNRTVTRTGAFGEGHDVVAAGRALCLTSTHARAIAERQFANLVETTSGSVTVAFNIHDESQPERMLPPGNFIQRLYHQTRGTPLNNSRLHAITEATCHWLRQSQPPSPPAKPLASPMQTRHAWDARRTPNSPFGEYEFALRTPLPRPVTLPATDWERAIVAPAAVWMEAFLGVEPADDLEDDAPNRTVGIWVHRWLARAIRGDRPVEITPMLETSELPWRVREAAMAFREHVRDTLERSGRTMPDWWHSLWANALSLGERLARRLDELKDWTFAATEWHIPETEIPGNLSGPALRVKGRIDLLLASEATPEGGRTQVPPQVWIVDFKTGAKKSLSLSAVRKGDGLQIALYGFALRALGSSHIAMSRLSPVLSLDEPQIGDEDLDQLSSFIDALTEMQNSGVFGMHGDLREVFGVCAKYPMATLAIDPEILEAKWALTHPRLHEEESDA